MPGAPPPEPTSTTGPSLSRKRSAARSESSSRTRRASSRPSAVRPDVSTTARSHASTALWSSDKRLLRRFHDDVAMRLVALALRRDAVEPLQTLVHEPPVGGAHRLEPDRAALAQRLLGAAHRERLERPAAAVAVPRGVDEHVLALVAPGGDRAHDRLDGVDRLPVLADQEPEVAAG